MHPSYTAGIFEFVRLMIDMTVAKTVRHGSKQVTCGDEARQVCKFAVVTALEVPIVSSINFSALRI